MTNFTEDQEIFSVKNKKGQIKRYGIPCRTEAEAFAVIYWSLGATWVGPKRPVN